MWSDPETTIDSWGSSPRGAGYLFGYEVAKEVRNLNNIILLFNISCIKNLKIYFKNNSLQN